MTQKTWEEKSITTRDAEAIAYLKTAIEGGTHWYMALLGAMGLWTSAEEQRDGRLYRYLIAGEAFDWLLLAERLCGEVDSFIPNDEREALLFQGKPLLKLDVNRVKELIGSQKYCQYLNYFYGVTVETALIQAVEGEVYKERRSIGYGPKVEVTDEAYRRIYGETKPDLLKRFRKEHGYIQRRSITLSELKEFTYFLFKYRLDHNEKPKVASDTRKALEHLSPYWTIAGNAGIPSANGCESV